MNFSKILAIVFAVVLIVVGLLSVILGIVAYSNNDESDLYAGGSPSYQTYGGDAYTGIQNAAVSTSRNVVHTNMILKFGFGSILLIAGFLSIAVGANKLFGETEIRKIIGEKMTAAQAQPVAVENKVDNTQTTENDEQKINS